jgi:hypothetical protein
MDDPHDLFAYDESSPSKLIWKVERRGGIKPGTHAGTLNKYNKMWHVQFRGGPKPVHRVLWEMFYGEVDVIVKHRDGNPSNNCISNLYARPAVMKSIAAKAADERRWNDIFAFDQISPSNIVWKIDNYTGHRGNVRKATVGEPVATTQDHEGYVLVSVGTKGQVRLHRILWEMVNGNLPDGYLIDHKDGNRSNNAIDNLRGIPLPLNARNVRKSVRNKTGVVGVNRKIAKNGGAAYRATWNDLDGKSCEKSFSVNRYGEAEAFRLACEYRAKMIAELNEHGAGYTERHGK